MFARTNGIENDFYLPENPASINKTEYAGVPVVFVVDKNSNHISHVFVPHKEVSEYFAKYIDITTGYVCD